MANNNDIVIVSAVRIPFGKFGGTIKKFHSTELGAMVIKEALVRAGITDKEIDELYYGMCIQSEAALEYNVNGRQALLKAGLREDLVSLTIDRACFSSLTGTPWEMAKVPAFATQKALKQAGVTLDQIDLIEINEAFAAVPLVSTKVLADLDEKKWGKLLEKTNVNGGAIAIGHPVGASGARILMTMMYELRSRGGGIGTCSICGGLSQGDAAVIRVD